MVCLVLKPLLLQGDQFDGDRLLAVNVLKDMHTKKRRRYCVRKLQIGCDCSIFKLNRGILYFFLSKNHFKFWKMPCNPMYEFSSHTDGYEIKNILI
jgi:hypothetical protein